MNTLPLLLVAVFDFLESVRSRRAIALLVLYVAGAAIATAGFVATLNAMQESAPISVSDLTKIIADFIEDKQLAAQVRQVPIVSLFYGWVALTFVPLLVVLTSYDAISSEVSSGSVRFALFRCSRASWVYGKLVGQVALMLVGLLAGAAGSYIVGVLYWSDYPALEGGLWTLRFSIRAAFYGFAYLGITTCASQLARTNNGARALALLGLCFVGLGGRILQWDVLSGSLSWFGPLFPQTHWVALWQPDHLGRLVAMIALVGIGLGWSTLGFLLFRRRDA